MDIYSGNRGEINRKITEYLNKDFSSKYGVEVLDASIIDVHLDKKLKQAVENRVQALQKIWLLNKKLEQLMNGY